MTLGNPYIQYYANQAGNGLGSFEGIRYQRGKGFFGSMLKNVGIPLLKYLGKQVLRTGVDVAGDVISGEPIKEALKTRSKTKIQEIAGDAAKRAEVFALTGRGRKLKKKRSLKKVKKLKNKTPKKKRSKTKRSKISSIF